MDRAYTDSARVDYTRCSVYRPDMDTALAGLSVDGASASLTYYELSGLRDGVPYYVASTITGTIQPQGTNLNGLTLGNYAKFAHTLFTPDAVQEGGYIIDSEGKRYDIHAVTENWRLDSFINYTCELFLLESAALYTLNYPLTTYTASTVYLNLANNGQGTPFLAANSLTRSNLAAVTHASIKEGDLIKDKNGVEYIVSGLTIHPSKELNDYNWTVLALTRTADATLKTLTLGATADTTTGHYPATYVESAIKIVIAPKGQSTITTSVGYVGRYDYQAVTNAIVYEGDIIEYLDVDYEVKHVTPFMSVNRGDGFAWYVCVLVKRDFAVEPASSGTWHTDSNSVGTDPRNRQKVLIDTYLTAANIKKDDGATNASTLTCFDGATYPITRVFLTKAVDAVAVISRGATSTLYTDWVFGHKPYGFEEQVKIEIYAVNKTGITASNLAEKFEQEIRRIYTTYDAYTNVRDLDTIEPSTIDLGYTQMCKTAINIKYRRANDDYSPSYPTITWGPSATATGTYTWPNVTKFEFRDTNTGEVKILPPGRLGEIRQILGNPDFEIILTSDMSLEPTAKTWKRAQSGVKTDDAAWEIFNEIKFTGTTDATKIYQTFNANTGATIPVRIENIQVDGENLVITLRRYSSTDQSAGAYGAFYGN